MCNVDKLFPTPYIFPYPYEVFGGVGGIITYKALFSLRQRLNQGYNNLNSYQSLQEYLNDLENNDYFRKEFEEYGQWVENIEPSNYLDLSDEKKNKAIERAIIDEIYGFKTEERYIHNPDHIHFTKRVISFDNTNNLGCEDLFIDENNGRLSIYRWGDTGVASLTPHILPLPSLHTNGYYNSGLMRHSLGYYCTEHKSIILNLNSIQECLVHIEGQFNMEFTESDLIYVVSIHLYGHYLAANASITFGEEDKVHVFSNEFEILFAQLVCLDTLYILDVKNAEKSCGNNFATEDVLTEKLNQIKQRQELFILLLEHQPPLYSTFSLPIFQTLRDNFKLLPFFLLRCKKLYKSNGNLISLLEIEQIASEIDKLNIEEENELLLKEIEANFTKALVFGEHSNDGTLNKNLFAGHKYCNCTWKPKGYENDTYYQFPNLK